MSAVVEREEPKSFPAMLKMYQAQIAVALPKHINADRMCRIALTCFRMNPGLAKCEPASIFAAVVILAQQGLEPGLNGRAYLVPYFNNKSGRTECQAIPGWKGLVELANRTGRCSVWTGAVFAGDEFDYKLGDNPFVTHKPAGEDDPAKLLYTYAIGRIKGNDYPVIEVWPQAKLQKHFKRYNKVGASHYAHGNWEMYARKIPLLQVLKYMPASPELEASMALADSAEYGRQNLNITDAIDAQFAPTYDEAEATESGQGGASVSEINDKIKGATKGKKAGADDPTVAQIGHAIQQAATVDALNIARDLIRHAPEEFQAGLNADASAKLATLSE